MTMVSFFRFDLKSERGKLEFACIKCNLSFKMTNGLSNAHASAWWKEAQQLQPVWLLKIFQLHTVQILLFNNLRSSMLKPIQEKNISSARVQVMFGSIPPALGVNTNSGLPVLGGWITGTEESGKHTCRENEPVDTLKF